MGVLRDLWRLMRSDDRERAEEREEAQDYAEMLRQSAHVAEMWAGVSGSQPMGTHGAATANPYANLAFLQSAIPAAGTVIALWQTGQRLGSAPIYQVELEITRDDWPPYRSYYQTVIAAGALPNWQPGKMLTFRVSPDDPHALMLG